MAKRRIKKKELKAPDEFTAELGKLVDLVLKRKLEIIAAAAVLIIILIGSVVFKAVKNSRLDRVNRLFLSAAKSGDLKEMELCFEKFPNTYLGKMAGLIVAERKYEEGKLKSALESLERVKAPTLSKFSFVIKATKAYLKGSLESETDPQKGLESFELVAKNKRPYLKVLSNFRRAVILDRMGGRNCLSLYESIAKDPRLSGSFMGNFSQERIFSMKNQ